MENLLAKSVDMLLFVVLCIIVYQILIYLLKPLVKKNKSIKKYLNAHPEIIRKKGRPAILDSFANNLARFLTIIFAFSAYALFFLK